MRLEEKEASINKINLLQKSLTVFLVVLELALCRADISLISPANNFDGYSYPKPKIPFETGFQKKIEVEKPTPTYLPPTTTTAR